MKDKVLFGVFFFFFFDTSFEKEVKNIYLKKKYLFGTIICRFHMLQNIESLSILVEKEC